MITKRESGSKGFGLFAAEQLAAGSIAAPTMGKSLVVKSEEVPEHLVNVRFAAKPGHSVIPVNPEEPGWWDANQSCSPNAALTAIGLMPLRRIRKGEELTTWYGWMASEATMPCECGNGPCNGDLALVDTPQGWAWYLEVAIAHVNILAIEAFVQLIRPNVIQLHEAIERQYGKYVATQLREASLNYGRLLRRARENNRKATEWAKVHMSLEVVS